MKLLRVTDVIGEIKTTDASKLKTILADVYGFYSTKVSDTNVDVMLEPASAKKVREMLELLPSGQEITYEILSVITDLEVNPVKYNKVFGWML